MLICLVVLINMLGFLMMTNIPHRSGADTNPVDQNSVSDQGSLVLLSDLSAEEREALNTDRESDSESEQEPEQKPISESESGSLNSLKRPD